MVGVGVVGTGLLLGWLWKRTFDPLPRWVLFFYLALPALYLFQPLFMESRFQVPAWGEYASQLIPFSAYVDPPPVAENKLLVDVPSQIFPWYVQARSELLAGRFPLYNPLAACGMPLLENAQASLFSLPLLATLWVTPLKGLTAAVFLQIFLTLLFTHAFLRSLDCSLRASLFGSVSFAFSAFAVAWMYFPIMRVLPGLPLMLYAVEMVRREGRRRHVALLSLSMAQMVVAGNPECAFFFIGFGLVHAGWALARRPKALVQVLGAGGAALLLSAFFWLPFLDYLPRSGKYNWVRTLDPSIWLNPPFDASSLIPSVMPLYYGLPTHTFFNDAHNFNFMAGYAGALSLFFAAWALPSWRRRPVPFYAGMGLLVVAALINLPPVSTLLRHMPIVQFAEFGRLRALLALVLVVLGSIGLDAFFSRSRPPAWPAALLAGLLLALAFTSPAWDSAPPLFLVKLTAGAVALLVFAFLARLRRGAFAAVMLLLALDLIWPLWGLNPVYPAAIAPRATPAVRLLQERGEEGRFVAEGVQFMPNVNALYGLEDVRFNDPMTPWTYFRFVKARGLIQDAYWRGWIRFEDPAMDFLGIRSILKVPDQPLPGREPLHRGGDGWVYDNPGAMPRFFFPASATPAPGGEALWEGLAGLDLRREALASGISRPIARGNAEVVSIRALSPTEYRVSVRADGERVLVASLPNLRPWKAEAAGAPLPKLTVNGHFCGWILPPGEYAVSIRYHHTVFKIGMALTALGLLLGGAYLFSARRISSASTRTM
jgi:hypothetical protein